MRVVTGGTGANAKTNNSYFLDRWAVLHLDLCSRASCSEPLAYGLSFVRTLSFWG